MTEIEVNTSNMGKNVFPIDDFSTNAGDVFVGSPEEPTEALAGGETAGGDACAAAPVVPEDWRIFPCRAKSSTDVDKDGYSLYPAKKPLISWKDPAVWSNDPIQLEKWAGQFPGYMQALPTGEINGIWVLDLDIHYDFCVDEADREAHTKALKQCFLEQRSFVPKKLTKEDVEIFSQYCLEHGIKTPEVQIVNGIENFKRYCSEHGHEFPKTLTVITPSGGLHLYFIMPIDGTDIRNSAGEILPGADVRGTGGYVIKPPSVNQDIGRAYEWEDPTVPIAKAEQWLVALVTKKKKPSPSATVAQFAGAVDDVRALGEKTADIWETKLAEIRSAEKGRRNPTLNKNACCLYGLAKAGKLTKEFIDLALWDAAHAMTSPLPEKEIRDTLASAWKGAGAWPTGAGGVVEVDDGPLPLRRPPGKPRPYPTEAFGELAQSVVDIADHTSTPQSMVGSTILYGLSLGGGRLVNVKVPQYPPTPLPLYFVTVGNSGDGKSHEEGIVLKPFEMRQKALMAGYHEMELEFERKRKAHEREKKLLEKQKLDKGAYLEALERLDREEPIPPVEPVFMTGDANVEGIHRLFRYGFPFLGLNTDEGAELFYGTAFSKDNDKKSISKFSSIWSGKGWTKTRHGDGASILYDRRLCMHIMIQPSLIREVLANKQYSDQGFLCRFLYSWPVRMAHPTKHEEIEQYESVQNLWRIYEQLLSLEHRQAEDGGLILDSLKLSPEAQKSYDDYHDRVDEQTLEDRIYEPVIGFARRAAENALRIAGCLSMGRDPASRVIDQGTMDAGIAIADWHLDEFLRIAVDEMTTPEILEAENLLHWFWKKGITKTSVSQVQQHGPNSLRENKKIRELLKILEEHRWMIPLTGGAEIWMGGDKKSFVREVWEVRGDVSG